MKIRFLGAAKTVTGSFFLVETEKIRFAVDCGLFQGPKSIQERNYLDFSIDPVSIDFLLLTHAHIDHIGLIPKLCKKGFRGTIYCSHATEELASILLPDSGYIQESEIERKNRKLKRSDQALLEPIYTVEDSLQCLPQFRSLNMDEIIGLAPGIEVRLRDAGHILGSCIVEIWVEEAGEKTKLVFSGDLGNNDQPIVKDPAVIESADYLIVESTYGDRLHPQIGERNQQLKEVIDETMGKGGNLIIPAFAVERTQDLLYDLLKLHNQGELDPGIEIYIDSPLAIATTEIFLKHTEYFDDRTRQFIEQHSNPLKLLNLQYSRTQEDSMRLNLKKRNCIIISASGMCEAGRIKHHLKHNLWRPESTVLIVGYQAEGTLGRKLLDGEKTVHIHGEKIAVKADIRSIEAYSAHADRNKLIEWAQGIVTPLRGIFIIHGEDEAQRSLAADLQEKTNSPVYIPEWLEEFELEPGRLILHHFDVSPTQSLAMEKTIMAEKAYLDLSQRLHSLFRENWQKGDYDKIIESLQKIEQAGVL
ncbi:MBL fold metallo-hydrolase RNA specificity domain-containing protein [Syntrophomonas wolfei]|uniref:RNA-metabolising metallo-beta-lactamase n=1 Tax=Syntrophomonas wolfei subsp. wolfei (strain DSM 2245B / Goettingen) TaxID=335541 RepID=Q0AXP2_SYNWW|nr:MBL fold metallo-hydrolase [Syntrophomonas wolfei]ABI68512.1 RNA-metabolising metallo-beta-lactamase [Syntrophomonas wolfei subsp. wolfei str. Goettingen G311]